MITENGGSPSITVIQRILPEGALATGIFGAIGSAGTLPLADCNTAVSGLGKTSSATKNVPDRSWPWGIVFTVSSEGAGTEGLREIPAKLDDGEVVYQMYFDTKSNLYVRSATWLTGWSGWVKRWG